MVSQSSPVNLTREPWVSYEISVLLCYGAYDSDNPVNLTLPIYKQNPAPMSGLSWAQDEALLSWEYRSSIPSGFFISICPSLADEPDVCSDIQAGPLDRQYHVRVICSRYVVIKDSNAFRQRGCQKP